jgi:hypothetical protein
VVNTLATTAVAALFALGSKGRDRMKRDIAWLQGLLSRDFNLKFN